MDTQIRKWQVKSLADLESVLVNGDPISEGGGTIKSLNFANMGNIAWAKSEGSEGEYTLQVYISGLTTSQVSENGNLYYTESRVSANTNVAANTASRHTAVTLGTANGLTLSTQTL